WANGMLIVASAGNIFESGETNVRYPAAFDNVIAVSGANATVDGLSAISRFGPEIELIAPGENIYTTSIDNTRYDCREGTAYSAGFVAGVAALVWSNNPGLTNQQVRNILTSTAVRIDGLDDDQQGYGLVRADSALGFDPPPVVQYTITAVADSGGSISPPGAVVVNEGASQSFSITADAGYQIRDVLVNGSSVGAVSNYTFEDVTKNHTIHASFEVAESIPLPLSIDWFDLTDTSNRVWARVRVDWEVSGEDLKTVKVDITGPNNDSRTWNVSGSSASGTHEFSFHRGFGTYTVTLTVTDGSGAITESKEIDL
ncbi:MAG: hypothetical protein EA364_09660, partial [Balneolaceae bacterium]